MNTLFDITEFTANSWYYQMFFVYLWREKDSHDCRRS